MPVIKLTVLTLAYKLTALVVQPIAEEKITTLIDNMGDVFKIFLAIIIVLGVMLIIGITLVLKISNTSIMYR